MPNKITTISMNPVAMKNAKLFGVNHDLTLGQTFTAHLIFVESLKDIECPEEIKKVLEKRLETAVIVAKLQDSAAGVGEDGAPSLFFKQD